jgi:hypothetical protein
MVSQRFVLVIALLVGSAAASAQATHRLPGCYQFADIHGGYFTWLTIDLATQVRSLHRSMIIELTVVPSADVPDSYSLRAPGLRDSAVARSYAAGSGWSRVGNDSVALTWGDGHGGIRMRVLSRGDSLAGRATHFADVLGGQPPPSFPVWGVRVACPGAPSP